MNCFCNCMNYKKEKKSVVKVKWKIKVRKYFYESVIKIF